MSRLLISEYHKEIDELIRFGGSRNESALEGAFQKLLNGYARPRGLKLVPKVEYVTKSGNKVYPDGTIKTALRLDWGYWEAKDEDDDLDTEIEKKVDKGYPTGNIVFEDGETAVLFQNGAEVERARHKDAKALDALLTRFFKYERPEIAGFHRAIETFKQDLPTVLIALRDLIEQQQATNKKFSVALERFLRICQESINPSVTPADVREMLIQHILTEDIFLNVFSDSIFHRHNNIAKALGTLEDSFFTVELRRKLFTSLESYYAAIKMSAAAIRDHHEKQNFLKAVYEDFYRIYNKKAADRLGVVYTPTEIVRFMIEGAEFLTNRHFGKLLSDKDVEILDPATGTGTYICELIEHFKADKKALAQKYAEELHCNEVAILPYYIANLNIEYTYAQAMGSYAEFQNILFVDTLDNLNFEHMRRGLNQASQLALLGSMSEVNVERIRRQNTRRISVIIGNPPYNANQLSENDNNKNREYPGVDKRIKDTYIASSTARKTKLYDMYARFLRWASDRLNHPERGVIAFVSNSSFIDSRSYDGFRKVVEEEFDEIRILDLKGDAHTSGERRRCEAGNVFSDKIRVGIAVSFFIRKGNKSGKKKAEIYYAAVPDNVSAEDKLAFLQSTSIESLEWQRIRPDSAHSWINLADENDYKELIPLADVATKAADSKAREGAIAKLFSLGVVTARDEWVYDYDPVKLVRKIRHLVGIYNADVDLLGGQGRTKAQRKAVADKLNYSIKWSRAVKNDLTEGRKYTVDPTLVRPVLYRPFVRRFIYWSPQLNEVQYQLPGMFPLGKENIAIAFLSIISPSPLAVLATSTIFDYCLLKQGNGATQSVSLYRYDKDGNRTDNITDFALAEFRGHYRGESPQIEKRDIFSYIYAVLHDPSYREKYAVNLKREFPHIPFYANFWQWADWGAKLLSLHADFDTAERYPLEECNTPSSKKGNQRARLRAEKETGTLIIDDVTSLSGVPESAWEYKLGNRSALEWVLDQYKESTPRDPTIRGRFNDYRLADHKTFVIDLLARVTTVSVETQKIVAAFSRQDCSSERQKNKTKPARKSK